MVIVSCRIFDGWLPAGHIVAGQQTAMHVAGTVEPFGFAAEAIDFLSDEALIEYAPCGFDHRLAVAALGFGLTK